MIDVKKFFKEFRNTNPVTSFATDEKNSVDVLENSVLKSESNTEENKKSFSSAYPPTSTDLSICTATNGQIDYWHSYGSHIFLQKLLRDYDLDVSSRAYNGFKIGYDKKQHVATFAIDETHYYKIQFDSGDSRPIDFELALKVLKKINSMRYDKIASKLVEE